MTTSKHQYFVEWIPKLGDLIPGNAEYRRRGVWVEWSRISKDNLCTPWNREWWGGCEFRVPTPKPLDTDLGWLLKKADLWAANQPDPDAARDRIRQAKAEFVNAVLKAIEGE